MKAIQNTIVEEMNALDDWMDKYDYIIAQGRDLRCADEAIRSDQYALAGCQSQVWIRGECRDGAMRYMADSDAQITRGLIALLLRVVNGQSPKRVAGADFFFIERTGLDRHLSPARGDGLAAIISELKRYARQKGA